MNCPFCGTPIEMFEEIYYANSDGTGLSEEPGEGRIKMSFYEPKEICCENCKPWLELYMRLTADEIKGGSG